MTTTALAARTWRADLMLLLVTLVWGSTFPAIKASLELVSPILLVCLRFSTASMLFMLLFPGRLRGLSRATCLHGLVLGLIMTGGYLAQTQGLGQTSASRSGFLTALYVAFTPPLQLLLGRGRLRTGGVVGAGVVLVGLYLLALTDGQPPSDLIRTLVTGLNPGDWWTLGCALLFALYILGVDILAPDHDPLQLTFVQMATAAVIAGFSAPLLETIRILPTIQLGTSVVYLGLFASLGAIFVQTKYQRETTPTRAAIIYAMEAVFSAVLAAAFLGDALGWYETLGGALIIAGLLVTELTRGT